MSFARILTSTLALLATSAVADLRLNVTAIGAEKGISTLECWELDTPFLESDDPAILGSRVANLGNVSGLTWNIAPPGGRVEAHNAPSNCWVVMVKGYGYVQLPSNDSARAYMSAGDAGLMFASDTADVSSDGHISTYIGHSESIYLLIPTLDGLIPKHKKLHMGPCLTEEMTG